MLILYMSTLVCVSIILIFEKNKSLAHFEAHAFFPRGKNMHNFLNINICSLRFDQTVQTISSIIVALLRIASWVTVIWRMAVRVQLVFLPVFVVAINATHFVTVDGQLSILRSIVTHGVRRKQRPIVHILRSKHVP